MAKAPPQFFLSAVLEKLTNPFSDFRYMAALDLCAELQKDSFTLEGENERKVVQGILKILPDNTGLVQNQALKCLGPLLKKIHEPSIGEIIDQLCAMLLKEKEDERDVACTCLKEVIKNVPSKDGPFVAKRLTPKLLPALSLMETLDILNDLLNRFGGVMSNDHESVMNGVLPQLTSNRPASRKKAISCLSYLSVSMPEKLFGVLVESILKNLSKTEKAEQLRSFVQAIGAISRSVGYRLGKYLSQIMPFLYKYSANDDEELKEICFQTFEALVLRCPKEVGQYLNNIIELCLKYMKYDPNYSAEEGNENDEMETEEEEEDDDDEGEYSADDDVSWKVRRTAVKCIDAVITTRPDLLHEIYTKVAPVLISRFREREETVKVDVFNTFIDILKQTSLVTRKVGLTENSPVQTLKKSIPKIVQTITRQLKEKSVKTRSGAFAVLKELALVLEGSLGDHMPDIITGIKFSLTDKSTNSNLKTDALAFLRILFQTHPPHVFYSHIKTISPAVFKSIGDLGYKVDAEALRVCSEIVKAIRPTATKADFDYKPFVASLYDVTLSKLKAQDIDQEVKECAINCTGLIVSHLGDELSSSQMTGCLKILLDRLGNEITRLTTAKTFALIAASPLKVPLTSVLSDVVNELITFLRKNNRHIKQSSLITLDVLVKNYGNESTLVALFPQVLTESAPLIGDSDLHLSYLALQLIVSITHIHHESASIVQQLIYPKVLDLLQSPLLQGHALQALLDLFTELVAINCKGFGFEVLLDSLLLIPTKVHQLPKQSFISISQCVAVLAINAKSAARESTVVKFIHDVKHGKTDSSQLLALLSLGEIGRRVELPGSQDSLQKVILGAFDSPNEEIKSAASFAFGSVAVGNLSKMLPVVLTEIKNNPKRQYLLLHSLREVISRQSGSHGGVQNLQPHLEKIVPILLEHCESNEEGTRNVVAECLGKLCSINPSEIIKVMKSGLDSSSTTTRSTIVTSVKFAIVDQTKAVDQILLPHMGHFLELLKDPEPIVRRCTLLTLNYAAHNKPVLIKDLLGKYLPVLYGETKLKPGLIREVDLGPFKHKVDDGLEIRKAAYECMNTLLETCLDKIDIPIFISHLVDGLGDHYDIKMQCHLILVRLSHLASAALLEALDSLVEPLRFTVMYKVKEGAVKQEIDRNEELVRSALRAVASINRIENIESCLKFQQFLKQTIKQVPELKEKFDTICNEDLINVSDEK